MNQTPYIPNLTHLSGHLAEILTNESPDALFTQAGPFMDLMMRYNCALREVKTKFEVLNDEFTVRYKRNPVESIHTRIKKPISILEKLERRGYPVTVESVRENLNDVAGIRIICSFLDDIYKLVDMFTVQDDIQVLAVKDYIRSPKSNGYRSLHLIIEIPIFLSDHKDYVKVEVQFRTIAMDFWASLEHKLQYKKDIENADEIAEQLSACAERIAALDREMQEISRKIENE